MELRDHATQSYQKRMLIHVSCSQCQSVIQCFGPIGMHYIKVRIEVLQDIPGQRDISQPCRAIISRIPYERVRSFYCRGNMGERAFLVGKQGKWHDAGYTSTKISLKEPAWIEQTAWRNSTCDRHIDAFAVINRVRACSLTKTLVLPGHNF